MIPTLSEALAERGFDTLTDVQEAVAAPELRDADLLVSAQTGSGKTVGFGLAIAPTLMGDADRFGPPATPLALVVAPTRELALQVQRELAWLFSKAGARVVSCIGGMDAREERRALERGAHIVVGTPGRLRDHIMRGAFDLSDIRAIVLDEADEMLDLGFREDLEFMLGEAPAERRTLLFSATVPPAIAELAKQYQRDAVRVTTQSRGSQHADIAYQAVKVAAPDLEHAIINLLRFHDAPTAIVFANTRATVNRLAARFANRGLSVVSLSGELSQDERSHALQALRDGRARVCVATDVAARGIDLPNLALVIHADLPTNTEALLHRSGRTGRAGRKGISALIVPEKAAKKAERLLKWAKIQAEWTTAPSAEQIFALDETRLCADPMWETDPTEAETAFAARLLAEQTPEKIAIACLRLYRAGLSAPEELNTRPLSAERPERGSFGPSDWFELSVGQDRRAEARWLLPLLCRAGDLDKTKIGKIRVQADTTLVEIARDAVPGLLARLGADGVLEDDVTARPVDGTPEISHTPRPRPDAPRGGPDALRGPRPPRAKDTRAAPVAAPKVEANAPRPDAPRDPASKGRPKHAKPARDAGGTGDDKPPRRDSRKPEGGKPKSQGWDKKGPGKGPGKGVGKSSGKGSGPRDGGGAQRDHKPATGSRSDATNPSKRMERPNGAKRGQGKPGRPPRGGSAPPRRKG